MFELFHLKTFCSNCGGDLDDSFRFCVFCGNATNDGNVPSFHEEESEENILRDYFSKGFTYEEIGMFLETKHNITLSITEKSSCCTGVKTKEYTIRY